MQVLPGQNIVWRVKCAVCLSGTRTSWFFRYGLQLSILSVCGVLLVEQFESKTQDQNLTILMQSPVSDPFWSLFLPHLVSL